MVLFNLFIVRKLTPLSTLFTSVSCFLLSLAAQNKKDCWGIHFPGRSCWTTGLPPAPTTSQQELKCTYHPINSPSPPHIEQLQEQERALKMQKDAIKKVREALLLPNTWTSLTKITRAAACRISFSVLFTRSISRWHHVVICTDTHMFSLSLSLLHATISFSSLCVSLSLSLFLTHIITHAHTHRFCWNPKVPGEVPKKQRISSLCLCLSFCLSLFRLCLLIFPLMHMHLFQIHAHNSMIT
jgi:hypothetical protein